MNIHWIQCIENFFTIQDFWATSACPENRFCPENFQAGMRAAPPPHDESFSSHECLNHRCRSRQIFGAAKDFCPIFPKIARKIFVPLLSTNFLTQRSWRPFYGMTSKKRSAKVGRHFLKLSTVGRDFRLDFQRFCPDFGQIKTFGVVLAPPANPPPPLARTSVVCLKCLFYPKVCTPTTHSPFFQGAAVDG